MTIGIQLIELLEKLHSIGYIHCDIKPDNIMIGDYSKNSRQMHKLYLIDFGISQRYLNQNDEHLPFSSDEPFKGNVIFSSKNAFDQKSLSRRDDIISLMYFLVFCVNSNLSWIDNHRPIADQFDEIARYKINTNAKDFCTS